MNDITRERLWRKLQVLPDEQLYQVLDYIEFLESKYAPGKAAQPTGLQRFAERLEDRLRMRSLAPQYIRGAVGIFGTARKAMEAGRGMVDGVVEAGLGVVDGLAEAGKELLGNEVPARPGAPGGASLPTPLPPAVPDPSAPGEAQSGSTSPRAIRASEAEASAERPSTGVEKAEPTPRKGRAAPPSPRLGAAPAEPRPEPTPDASDKAAGA